MPDHLKLTIILLAQSSLGQMQIKVHSPLIKRVGHYKGLFLNLLVTQFEFLEKVIQLSGIKGSGLHHLEPTSKIKYFM